MAGACAGVCFVVFEIAEESRAETKKEEDPRWDEKEKQTRKPKGAFVVIVWLVQSQVGGRKRRKRRRKKEGEDGVAMSLQSSYPTSRGPMSLGRAGANPGARTRPGARRPHPKRCHRGRGGGVSGKRGGVEVGGSDV